VCIAVNCIKNCQQYSLQNIIECDGEEQTTANSYENSVTYVSVKSNISQYKVSNNHTIFDRHGLVGNIH
jgi:hypothetical protein